MSSGVSGLLVAGSLCRLMVALVCQICLSLMWDDAEFTATSRKSAVRNR